MPDFIQQHTLVQYLTSQISLFQYLDYFIRIIVACLCGAAIGVERSKRLKEAGLRTHIIVCCAAAIMMIVSKYGFADLTNLAGENFHGTRGADAARIAAQVVSGISFLGAGVIFKNGSTIKGLTTAAGIWATAGIGLAIGSGLYGIGLFSTGILLLIQFIMHKFKFGAESFVTTEIKFTVKDNKGFKEKLLNQIKTWKLQIERIKINEHADESGADYHLVLRGSSTIKTDTLLDYFTGDENINNVDITPGS